jgi:gamma-glutamylcyclotransferase (GGCT)/AIG2-like uncharacterized protein YtfP
MSVNIHCRIVIEDIDIRLIVYGTLAPGRVNHGELNGLKGTWRKGTVRGWLNPAGWAADIGYPGLVLDAHGPAVDVHVFESPDLPEHWSRLDAFEGSDYRRVATRVCTASAELDGWIYIIASPTSPNGS